MSSAGISGLGRFSEQRYRRRSGAPAVDIFSQYGKGVVSIGPNSKTGEAV